MSDVAYYQRRLQKERELAKAATNADVAKAHDEVAILYQKMLDALEGRFDPASD